MPETPTAAPRVVAVADPGPPAVRGFLHHPAGPAADALVLGHGAGSDCRAPLLVALAEAFAARGLAVLRCDLPFRQASAAGPPSPATGPADRDGLRRALAVARGVAPGRLFLGGHSYGGRQASMLAADDPGLAAALLLLAYPLHPPRQPAALRTAHFPALRTPVLLVHGSRDPYGTPAELRAALALIPARTALLAIEGADHALARGRAGARDDVVDGVVCAFFDLIRTADPERDAAVESL
jgi:predicted alpha/beta-hydrolase family hydrolase